ncbi:MAG: hypothetical protein KA144_05430 [Xanthomonadaceae bacterium]|nr:hypothetical protein [Xanthomonadaceae bacterium]
MIKALIAKLLRRPSEPTVSTPPQNASPPVEDDGSSQFGRWLTADDPDNPFGVAGFDCRAFTQSMLSTTSDSRIAESFLAERQRTVVENPHALPDGAAETASSLSYAYRGEIADGAICKAATMEEKWDIYLHGERLYFCRSWTGQLIFAASFAHRDDTISIDRIWTSDAPEFSILQIDYLIRSHLFRTPAAHPLPDDLPREPQAIASYSFSQYGKRCGFGVYGDTTQVFFRE